MKSESDDELLARARQAAERLLVNLQLRRDDLKEKGDPAPGAELVDRTIRAVQNVHQAIERLPGQSKDALKSRDHA